MTTPTLRSPKIAVLFALFFCACQAFASPDPLASNNGLYPAAGSWTKPYRIANFNWPSQDVAPQWPADLTRGPLTPATAEQYVNAYKKLLEPGLRGMIESPWTWTAAANGWYDMPWMAQGDAENGRDSILGSFTGQVILQSVFKQYGLTTDMQNHTVVYYNGTAAAHLRRVWADIFRPDLSTARSYPEGSIVIKAGAVTANPSQWPVVTGAAQWVVYRPNVKQVIQANSGTAVTWKPELVPLRVLQFDIIVKDKIAAPQTGWVFISYVHDPDAPGRPWEKLVPLGAAWGNDPPPTNGSAPQTLQESWINPKTPPYSRSSLGWGGRLSGPIDISERNNVVLTDGTRIATMTASACMSCHGTAQYPFISNLYPSPNKSFPPDGQPFLLYPPGSEGWNKWFQNKPGTQPQDEFKNSVGLDYDMLLMFAIGEANAVTGGAPFVPRRVRGH